jgi:hypothetical protein
VTSSKSEPHLQADIRDHAVGVVGRAMEVKRKRLREALRPFHHKVGVLPPSCALVASFSCSNNQKDKQLGFWNSSKDRLCMSKEMADM